MGCNLVCDKRCMQISTALKGLPEEDAGERLCCELNFATSAMARMKGLLFAERNEDVLFILPCSDIHTVGMRSAIDVAFVGKDGRVLDSTRKLPPLCRRRKRGAVAVMERFACEEPWPEPGDKIVMSYVRGCTRANAAD